MISEVQLSEKLIAVLGESVSDRELHQCLKAMSIVKPPPAKPFWQFPGAKPGIYIVLTGKVRLLDPGNNLIATLTTGASFGELTLFSNQAFAGYSARASTNLKLAYFTGESLQSLITNHPQVRDRLLKNAEIFDSQLLYRHRFPGGENTSSWEVMGKILSRCDRNPIEGMAKLCFIYKGELVHPDGRRLTEGNIYADINLENWQKSQSSVIYSLNVSDWQRELEFLPQLSELSELSELLGVQSEPQPAPVFSQKPLVKAVEYQQNTIQQNVIPFPTTPRTRKPPKQRRAYFPSPTLRVGHWWGRLVQRYPFYEQQSAADCGAACLVMIGRYWGKRFSVNRLRDLTNVSRSGASLRAVAAAAEIIGFTTRPVKASLDQLAQQPLPAIAHWEGKHFIVVYEITRKRVIVGDPAIGQRQLSIAEFKTGWTEYALLLQPTALLQEASEQSTPFWQFFDLIKPHFGVLLEVFLASVLIQIFGLVTPLFTQLLLDRVIVQGSVLTLNAVGFGLLIFGLFRVIINGLRQYLLDHTANRVGVALMVGFIKHTFRLPLSFFESRYVGDIISRVQENQKIQRFLTGEALSIGLDLLTVFIYVGLMFWYSWQMALLSLTIVPPFFLLALIATPFLRRISKEVFSALASENSYLIQGLTGITSIRSMAIEQTVRWNWEEQLNHLVKKNFKAEVISNQLQIFSATIQTLVTTALLWYGAWLVIQNQLTIGQLIAFNMLLSNVITPFQRLIVLWNQLQEVIVSTERINDVLEAEPEEDLQHQPRQFLDTLQGQICFEHVTFRYHPESEVNVLENLSFTIQPEQSVAIVGRSGSGKTTLSKLILGLYLPTDGKILIDGQDITSVSLRSLRSQIGVVDQDTFLFGGTIRENISIAHPEATQTEIIDAATLAGADEFIKRLPMGYETQIGEGGGLLSGGQRQRIAIARALLGNPRLLLLDEATSHLDAESEGIIQKNLKTILKGRTSLIIAHRLSTVRHADLILVLDQGILVESGTHQELINQKGHYFYLNQQQLNAL